MIPRPPTRDFYLEFHVSEGHKYGNILRENLEPTGALSNVYHTLFSFDVLKTTIQYSWGIKMKSEYL